MCVCVWGGGGGGGERVINTSALNCNQLLNISKTIQLISPNLCHILGNYLEYYQSGKFSQGFF